MTKKIALVTGANKGIGFETAKQLGKKGITIIAAARNAENGNKAVSKLKAEGIDAEFLQLDVNNTTQIQQAFEYINNKYGKLDILINNAGIAVEHGGWGANTAS
ncbi:MAG: SDR family NAD(P)-dependent oxidoreductase, partial [Bacteroidota bacterium]|nr:SDR family NAD(P)-dependent oxidoreductase [Bacteroidota bacterium]